ncbi:armadillo/beta-catenin repeat family protein [Tripterygium wilfordii]|uniref:Armadillo/beta-catenin repeat family protein n=2 Tax=Tripterygium wilfordii TaxID=458696 RepID=A0A7J7C463_TRIWF|nr:armadillo/beta-catenin repeat family protein [Tripterygium wilfordii]
MGLSWKLVKEPKMGQEEGAKEDRNPLEFSKCRALHQVSEVISSLISLSYLIKAFAVKWQLIRNKLEELNSGLIAAENCDTSQNPSLSALIPLILVTVNECHDLARRCVDLSYSGKLLMQSDLDVIAAKIDTHLRKLSRIYTAGILSQGFAIVVSRPGANACAEDMRFYMRDLFTRMKIGDTEMKKQALVNLHEVVVDDERYLKIVAFEVDDLVNLLVNFLDSSTVEIQEGAVKVVSVISGFDSYKGVLIRAGIIGHLISVLEIGSELAKESSARSLQKLTSNSDNAWSVSAHGGVTALLKICANGDSRGELIGSACAVLRNLSGVEEMKRFMIEENAISTFIKLARSKDESVQVNSIDFLQNITYGDESVKQLIIKEGGIRALVRILDPKSTLSSKTREIALRAIENLFFSSMSSINIVMNYGFLDHLLFFLRMGDVSIQELALKVSFRLSGISEETKRAMGDAGFMPEFVRLMDSKSFEVREMAAEALSGMVSVTKNRRRFVQDDRSVGFLLQLLDQKESNSGNRKFLLNILMSLTSSNSGRKKIASSGYLKNIEKLAEAEVSDAKRLVRKLSSNRFRIMLSGIWHS